MKVRYASINKAGRRSNNEDTFRIIYTPESGRWMGLVADGMGGHALGEVASDTVASTIADYWQKFSNMYDCEDKVIKACKKASVAIDRKSISFNHCQMGTTLVCASVSKNSDGVNIVTIFHIGDSRCYLMRPGYYDYDDINNTDKDNVVYQTHDHINIHYGWETVSKCFFSYRPEVAVPDIVQFEVHPGDRIFLCSDGIYKCIVPNILKARLTDDKSPEEILDGFDFLCERSGDDNYTGIIAFIDE